MANNFVFNDSLPVAPLKLAALESCKDFASKVDSHIVQFRRNDMEELKRRKADLHYRGYDVTLICWILSARDLVPVRQRQ